MPLPPSNAAPPAGTLDAGVSASTEPYNPYTSIVAGMSHDSAPATTPNPYSGVVQNIKTAQTLQRAKAALSVGQSVGESPEAAASNAALAKHFATTPQAVGQDPQTYKALLQTDTARQALRAAPTLQRTLAKTPGKGAVVQGSVVDAAHTEAVMRSWDPSLFQRARQALDNVFGMPERRRAWAANEIAAKNAGLTPAQARTAVGGTGGELRQFGGSFINAFTAGGVPSVEGAPANPEGVAANVAGSLAGFILGPAAWAKAILGAAGVPTLIDTALSATKAAPTVQAALSSVLTGATELGTATAISNVGGNLNAPSTGGFAEQELASAGSGAAMGSVFGALSKIVPGGNVPAFLTRFLAANTAMQALHGEVPYANLGHLASMSPQQQTRTLLNYGMNAFFTLHGDTRPANDFKAALVKSFLAERDAQNLDAVTKLSDNKWRQVDPEGWHQFVSDVADEGAIPHLYVEGKTLHDALMTDPKGAALLEKMPEVAKQLSLALETNGDVRVPMADYTTHLAGTEVGRSIQPEIKASASGFTFAQAQHFYQGIDTEFAKAAKDLVAPLAQDVTWEKSRKAVAADIARQLGSANATVRSGAKDYATYRSHFFATLAQEEGITPEEAYAKYGAGVVPRTEAQAFHKNLVKAAAERKAQGDAFNQTVWHASPFKFSNFTLDHLGKGEDSQNYSEGLYFAGEKKVAEFYKAEGGHLYSAHIPPTDTFMHYDKPLSEQPEVMRKLGVDPSAKTVLPNRLTPDMTGQQVYRALARGRTNRGVKATPGAASAYLYDLGIPGMTYVEGAHVGRPARNFVLWSPDAVKHVEHFDQINGAQPLGQYSPSRNLISLFQNADLSTFLHESGHEFLHIYGRVAAQENAPVKITEDLDNLLKWFGIEGADSKARITRWNAMSVDEQRPYHERFARAWEQHLMEGKAPSLALRGVFRKFRAWLLGAYRSMTNLGEAPSAQVKGVMDRMLASEKEIEAAQHFQHMEPLFTEKPDGVSESAWAAYQGLGREATDTAVSELQAKSMRDMRWLHGAKSRALKGLQKDARAAREKVRAQVTGEVDKIPLYAAEKAIRYGDPEADVAPVKMSLPVLKAAYGDGPDALWRRLPKGKYGMVAQDGADPELIAELYGLPSAKALVEGLASMESREDLIDGLTDTRMLRDHGALATPEAIETAADKAIHNDARARFIATGLRLLTKSPVPVRRMVAGARDVAQTVLYKTKVRDVSPSRYEAAEARSAKKALTLVKNDPAGSSVAQRAQLLNHELTKASQGALADIEKGIRYFRKFSKASIRENISGEFMDQIDALLSRFDLRSSITPEKAAQQRKQSLDNFVEKLGAMGFHPAVPARLLDELNKQHYKNMEVGEFTGLVEGVKSLEKIGRSAQTIRDGDAQRLVAEVAQEGADQLSAQPKRKLDSNRGLTGLRKKWMSLGHGARSFMASLIRTEQMVDWLDDGNPNGVYNRMVFRKAADAEGVRNELNERVSKQVDAHVRALPKTLLSRAREVYSVPGVIDSMTGSEQKLTWSEKMALAGVRGDAGAFAKLLKGEGWEAANITDFLDQHMSLEEWDFVKGLAAQFEDVYAVKKEMLKALGDTSPKDVDRIAFTTSSGDMPGWYWPITYDPSRSSQVAERRAKDVQSVFEDNYFRTVDTSTGREFTRNENYAKPMLLSLETVPRVLQDEIRDATTRVPLMEIERFLKHPTTRKAINDLLGPEYYEAMRGWLVSMANDRAYSPRELQWWDRLAQGTRTRVTMVGLGFRLSTMALHGITAAGESAAEVGPKALIKGALDKRTRAAFIKLGPKWVQAGADSFMRSEQWGANRDFIFDHSDEMRYRTREFERDVRERLREISIQLSSPALGKIARAKLAIESRAYSGIAMLDMASALPTWMGAYLKGIEKTQRGGLGYSEQDAVYFADKTVRNAHGSGGIKDVAAVQRGAEWMKLFTMFYTFWNHNLNRIADSGRRIKGIPRNYRQAVASGEWGAFSGDMGMLLMRTFMYTLGVQAVHAFIHPPKKSAKPNGWLESMGKDMALSTMSGIPVLRDLANAAASGYDYEATPFVGAVKNSTALYRDFEGTSRYNQFYVHAMNEAGYITGLPLGQPASTTKFLWDVWDGRQNPQDIQQWWHGLSTGRGEQ